MADESLPATRISLLLDLKDPKDSRSWTEFVATYRPAIVAWVKRMGVQESDADDIAQGVLAKLIDEMGKFRYNPAASFRGWLRRVTQNAVRDFFRRSRRMTVGGEAVQDKLQEIESPDHLEASAQALQQKLQFDVLREAEARVKSKVSSTTWGIYKQRRKAVPARDVAADYNMKEDAVHKAKSRVVEMVRKEVSSLLTSTRV